MKKKSNKKKFNEIFLTLTNNIGVFGVYVLCHSYTLTHTKQNYPLTSSFDVVKKTTTKKSRKNTKIHVSAEQKKTLIMKMTKMACKFRQVTKILLLGDFSF